MCNPVRLLPLMPAKQFSKNIPRPDTIVNLHSLLYHVYVQVPFIYPVWYVHIKACTFPYPSTNNSQICQALQMHNANCHSLLYVQVPFTYERVSLRMCILQHALFHNYVHITALINNRHCGTVMQLLLGNRDPC